MNKMTISVPRTGILIFPSFSFSSTRNIGFGGDAATEHIHNDFKR